MTKIKNDIVDTVYIVTINYNRYAFKTIGQASSFVEAFSHGVPVAYDYHAESREDNADCYYKEKVTRIATIEAVKAVIAETQTPKSEPEDKAA